MVRKIKALVGELFGELREMEITESERLHYLARGKLVIVCDKGGETE